MTNCFWFVCKINFYKRWNFFYDILLFHEHRFLKYRYLYNKRSNVITFNKSNGCTQQDDIALATPPKYQRSTLFVFSTNIVDAFNKDEK